MSILTLRPSGDGATHNLSVYPADGVHYTKLDEVAADDADYVYLLEGAGVDTQTEDIYSITDTSKTGTITSVKIYARAKTSVVKTEAKIYLGCKDGVTDSSNDPQALALDYVVYSRTFTTAPSGGAWTWTQINALTVNIFLGAKNNTSTCSHLYVEVDYTAPPYFDSIDCLGMSNGYANVKGILRADCPALAYKQAQIDDAVDFATPLSDTAEVAAAGETGGATVSAIASWVPSAAGTYYARLGARASDESTISWNAGISFVVNFPTITSIAVAQTKEHVVVTVTVSDTYVDPPEVTVSVDKQAYVAHL